MKTTIGGDRLGSGQKENISMRNYERSTHDLSYTWRSSMSAGTLVPFMSEVALPGDTFDIDLACDVMTLPTIGPLFGSYKVQLDVFLVPVRLYQAKLHMNMLNIGMNMSNIYLPQVEIEASFFGAGTTETYNNTTQVNPSALFSYLNIRGLGRQAVGTNADLKRRFNAVPFLAYWDIFKCYYSNKQETNAWVITNPMTSVDQVTLTECWFTVPGVAAQNFNLCAAASPSVNWGTTGITAWANIKLPQNLLNTRPTIDWNTINITGAFGNRSFSTLFNEIIVTWDANGETARVDFNQYKTFTATTTVNQLTGATAKANLSGNATKNAPQLSSFPLKNIDDMRLNILAAANSSVPFVITKTTNLAPYHTSLQKGTFGYRILSNQEGLAVKTYQSDLFNNWIRTSFITGAGSVTALTQIDTSGGSFTIDTLNLAQKVYDMLNRVAVSGGTYDDWLNAVYTHERAKGAENPVYQGSLIKELSFEEVISQADSADSGSNQPLGTLAGRGRLTQKNKGGRMVIRVDEPSYIMGIVSLTPRIEYSQGNKWDTNLETMNDFHKPALDAIGYQDLITDQMAYFDTVITSGGVKTFKSAGKQPAWINYMTNVPVTRGNFAVENSDMFMTLNRRYEWDSTLGIKDVTTYIDPTKFNTIFAQSNLDAQNFWVQILANITARRKMSAKVIPNL
jgi:hypothetical protein